MVSSVSPSSAHCSASVSISERLGRDLYGLHEDAPIFFLPLRLYSRLRQVRLRPEALAS